MVCGSTTLAAFAHLFFPHQCCGCGSDLLPRDGLFCLACQIALPYTGFESLPGNPVERLFYGRVGIGSASAMMYFTPGSAVQRTLHAFKYQGNQEIGRQLGRLMGHRLAAAGRFAGCEAVVPLPLHAARLRKRGYNQAEVLARAMAGVLGIPCLPGLLERFRPAATQTKKGRQERWQSIQGSFRLRPQAGIGNGRHFLLADDVVTTGATLEAAARVLAQQGGARVSIAAVACSVPA